MFVQINAEIVRSDKLNESRALYGFVYREAIKLDYAKRAVPKTYCSLSMCNAKDRLI